METSTFDYLLDGVPEDLAELVKNSPGWVEYMTKKGASGIKLVRDPNGWSDIRTEEQSDEAFTVEIMFGGHVEGQGASVGLGGRSYAKLEGKWYRVQTCQF